MVLSIDCSFCQWTALSPQTVGVAHRAILGTGTVPKRRKESLGERCRLRWSRSNRSFFSGPVLFRWILAFVMKGTKRGSLQREQGLQTGWQRRLHWWVADSACRAQSFSGEWTPSALQTPKALHSLRGLPGTALRFRVASTDKGCVNF